MSDTLVRQSARGNICLALGGGALGLAWLVPNHELPWISAWNDAVAFFALGLIWLGVLLDRRATRDEKRGLAWPLAFLGATCCTVALLQWALGTSVFRGDALMVVLYLGAWMAALYVGHAIMTGPLADRRMDMLMSVFATAAMASVLLAGLQWTGAWNLEIYVLGLGPGGRAYGNLGQPNHLSTLCFMGICAVLYLYEQRVLGKVTLWLLCFGLTLGMALTQSRTGWLQMVALAVWLGWHSRAAFGRLRLAPAHIGGLMAMFVMWALLLPWLGEALLLGTGRSLQEQMRAGVRLPYWWSMADAIFRAPWLGYGWLQTGYAQQVVAMDHPNLGVHFSDAHNLVISLMLWNGVPLGLALTGLLAWWCARHIKGPKEPRTVLLMASIGGVLLHSMLEYPLDYAYFLLPVGLMMGAVDALAPRFRLLMFSRLYVWLALAGMAVLGGMVLQDYWRAEMATRTMRLESARIGTPGLTTPPPSLPVLDQLESFMRIFMQEVRPGMSATEIDRMRKVAQRYGTPAVLFVSALASGLNGDAAYARLQLDRICAIYTRANCKDVRQAWLRMQQIYPKQLDAIYAPVLPYPWLGSDKGP